jgi:hypothetical protein
VAENVGTTDTPVSGTVSGENTIKLYGSIRKMIVTNSSSTTKLTAVDVSNCPNLINITVPRNQLTELDLSNNPLITYVSVYNNSLNACALDALYESLPAVTGTTSLVIYNNPGAPTSKTSIATDKGWTLASGSAAGNGTGCIESSVETIRENNEFSVRYANGKLYIANAREKGDVHLEVWTVNGQILINTPVAINAKTSTVTVGTLNKGVYLLKLSGKTTAKFIVH